MMLFQAHKPRDFDESKNVYTAKQQTWLIVQSVKRNGLKKDWCCAERPPNDCCDNCYCYFLQTDDHFVNVVNVN